MRSKFNHFVAISIDFVVVGHCMMQWESICILQDNFVNFVCAYAFVVFYLMLLARVGIPRVKVERGDDEFTSCTHRSGAPPTKAPT